MTCPEAQPDGWRDGEGHWWGRKYYPDAPAPVGAVGDTLARNMRLDTYREMQALLMDFANCPFADDARPALDRWQKKAQALVAGMQRPKTASVRGYERAQKLRTLAEAYETAGDAPADVAILIIEALKAWERTNLPQPLDPELLDRT